MIEQIKGFFSKVIDLFSFAFLKRSKIENTISEVNDLIIELNKIINNYNEITKDKQITLPEAIVMIDNIKNLANQLETTKTVFDSIFKK